ncbi:MAG: long-chain fatty acid--CoA ligase [Alphaproteobacteria bacterium]|nr:long-chain fatty acid--CoA ligase [Alphaproteobacteria bacterium]MCB9698310.1 long-chain fatty acid--CoA ligase [Alphaproteobacteria bacterium]
MAEASGKFANLVDLCRKSCEAHASRELFGTKTASGWSWITYGEFAKMVDAVRAGLAAMGVGEGDAVGMVADNRVEWAVAAYATYGLNARFVPTYEATKPSEWQFILSDCDAKVVIGSKVAIVEKLRGIRGELPNLKHIIGLELPADDAESWQAMIEAGKDSPVEPRSPAWDDIAGFIYTSGTTGAPKGVKLSHGNICSNVNAIHECFTFSPEDRSLSFLPWAHSFGQTCELHGLLSMGASLALNDDIPNLIPNLADVKPTILFAVPRIFNRVYDSLNKQMAERPGFIQSLFHTAIEAAAKRNGGGTLGLGEKLQLALADKLIFGKVRDKLGGRLNYAISGSAALSPDVARFIDALGIQVYEGYGLTETSPIATANFPGARKIGSVGKPIPGVKIVIDKAVTGDAVNGEILVYGPNVMKGYHHREDENKAVLMEDGGFRTGDMGRLDDDGYLWITGRIKEQYKLENGKYVVPSPLEEELKLSPLIANVMIYGTNKPHNVALVVPDKAALDKWAADNGVDLGDVASNPKVIELLKAEVAAHSKGAFKGYERPKDILITTDDFTTDNGLLTPTMKLKRNKVLEIYGAKLDGMYGRPGSE